VQIGMSPLFSWYDMCDHFYIPVLLPWLKSGVSGFYMVYVERFTEMPTRSANWDSSCELNHAKVLISVFATFCDFVLVF
jgi:hypothetical protein